MISRERLFSQMPPQEPTSSRQHHWTSYLPFLQGLPLQSYQHLDLRHGTYILHRPPPPVLIQPQFVSPNVWHFAPPPPQLRPGSVADVQATWQGTQPIRDSTGKKPFATATEHWTERHIEDSARRDKGKGKAYERDDEGEGGEGEPEEIGSDDGKPPKVLKHPSNSDWSFRRLRMLPTRKQQETIEALLQSRPARRVEELQKVRTDHDVRRGGQDALAVMKEAEAYLRWPNGKPEVKERLLLLFYEIRKQSETLAEHIKVSKKKARRKDLKKMVDDKREDGASSSSSTRARPWQEWASLLEESGLVQAPDFEYSHRLNWRAPLTQIELKQSKVSFMDRSHRDRRRRSGLALLREYRRGLRKLTGDEMLEVAAPANFFQGELSFRAAQVLKAEMESLVQESKAQGNTSRYIIDLKDFLLYCSKKHSDFMDTYMENYAIRKEKDNQRKRQKTTEITTIAPGQDKIR